MTPGKKRGPPPQQLRCQVAITHNGKRHEATYVIEGGMLTLSYFDGDGFLQKSAHVHGPGKHQHIARLLLAELVVPESERLKK